MRSIYSEEVLSKNNLQFEDDQFYSSMVFHSIQSPFEEEGYLCELKNEDFNIIEREISSVMLSITRKCNSRCRICSTDDMPCDDMSLVDIENILKNIGKNKKVMLYGGEPTSRDDIFSIIRLIKKHGHIPVIFTNGLKLQDLKYVKKLKRAGLEYVLFSFDGFRKEIYEEMRGDENQLRIKLRALDNLRKEKISVQISVTVAAGINEKELCRIIDFARSNHNFIKGVIFYSAIPSGRFDIKTTKTMKTTEIFDFISSEFPAINKEYALEFKRFIMNLHKFFGKFSIKMSLGKWYPTILFKLQGDEIRPLMEYDDLIDINNSFERGKYINLLKKVLKYSNLVFRFSKELFRTAKFETSMIKDKILCIRVGQLSTKINHNSFASDTVNLTKHNNKIHRVAKL